MATSQGDELHSLKEKENDKDKEKDSTGKGQEDNAKASFTLKTNLNRSIARRTHVDIIRA